MADDKPYGDVEYADPEDGKYPIDTEEHCRAALAYVNMPKNAAVLGDKLAAVKAKIVAACKKFGIDVADHAGARAAPSNDVEQRFTIAKVELRAPDEDTAPGREIFGYAAVFNSPSRNLGYFVERSAPGFLNKAAADGWPGAGAGVVCRFNHNPDFLLGTTRGGTLRLSLDGKGLLYSALLPECRNDVRELTARGDVNGSSYAMIVSPDGGCEWSYDDTGVVQRTLTEAQLIDVAPVSEPAAYPSATVGLRSLARQMHASLEEVEELARQDELRRFFVRTDIAPPTPPLVGPGSQLDFPPTEEPTPPALFDLPQPMSPAVALMHIQGRRYAQPIKTSQ